MIAVEGALFVFVRKSFACARSVKDVSPVGGLYFMVSWSGFSVLGEFLSAGRRGMCSSSGFSLENGKFGPFGGWDFYSR